MMKNYIVNGKEYLYEEGRQPEGAVELRPAKKEAVPKEKVAKPQNKAVKPDNKSRAVRKK